MDKQFYLSKVPEDNNNNNNDNNNNNIIAVTQRVYAHCDTISNRKCRMRVINYCT